MSITAAEQSRQTTDDRTYAIQFRIFSLLFAVAILFHQAFHDWYLRPPPVSWAGWVYGRGWRPKPESQCYLKCDTAWLQDFNRSRCPINR